MKKGMLTSGVIAILLIIHFNGCIEELPSNELKEEENPPVESKTIYVDDECVMENGEYKF